MTKQLSNDRLKSFWMPFSSAKDFRKNPRMIRSAQGHYYTAEDGRQIYDFFAGLWTTNVGHCHPKIVEAVQKQVAEMDYGCLLYTSPSPRDS